MVRLPMRPPLDAWGAIAAPFCMSTEPLIAPSPVSVAPVPTVTEPVPVPEPVVLSTIKTPVSTVVPPWYVLAPLSRSAPSPVFCRKAAGKAPDDGAARLPAPTAAAESSAKKIAWVLFSVIVPAVIRDVGRGGAAAHDRRPQLELAGAQVDLARSPAIQADRPRPTARRCSRRVRRRPASVGQAFRFFH